MKRTGLMMLAVLLFTVVAACRTTTNDAAQIKDGPGRAPEYIGCFQVAQATVTRGDSRAAQSFAAAKQICISDRQSRSGRFAFELKTGEGALINTIGMSLAEAQPRCPHCYDFSALEGSAMWRAGDQRRPIGLTMNLRNLNAEISFELARGGVASVASGPEYIGCHQVEQSNVVSGAGVAIGNLTRAREICIADRPSRSGRFAFEFKNEGELISTSGMDLATAQPRCPGCYNFSGLEGSAEWDGQDPSQPIQLRFKFRNLRAEVHYTLSRAAAGDGVESVEGRIFSQREGTLELSASLRDDGRGYRVVQGDGFVRLFIDAGISDQRYDLLRVQVNPAPRCPCFFYANEGYIVTVEGTMANLQKRSDPFGMEISD